MTTKSTRSSPRPKKTISATRATRAGKATAKRSAPKRKAKQLAIDHGGFSAPRVRTRAADLAR